MLKEVGTSPEETAPGGQVVYLFCNKKVVDYLRSDDNAFYDLDPDIAGRIVREFDR